MISCVSLVSKLNRIDFLANLLCSPDPCQNLFWQAIRCPRQFERKNRRSPMSTPSRLLLLTASDTRTNLPSKAAWQSGLDGSYLHIVFPAFSLLQWPIDELRAK